MSEQTSPLDSATASALAAYRWAKPEHRQYRVDQLARRIRRDVAKIAGPGLTPAQVAQLQAAVVGGAA